jgi:acyl-ACP thioesterase
MIHDDLRTECHFSQVHGFVSWVLFLQPRLNDMDMNQHVNNVKYIGWVLEVPLKTPPDPYLVFTTVVRWVYHDTLLPGSTATIVLHVLNAEYKINA